MENGIPAAVVPQLHALVASQVGWDEVVRWKKYVNKGEGVREQNSLQHSLSITILGWTVMAQLRSYNPFIERGLVMAGLAIHDVPEFILRRDVLHIDKTVEKDLQEYLAFRQCYEPLGSTMFDPLHRAYLLQFARKNPEIFPADGRRIMADIRGHSLVEALMFEAVEQWDYVLYALEQYRERGNEKILVQTLRNQIASIGELKKLLPGFREEIWTDDFSLWVNEFLKAHEGQWIEQKGEV